MQHAQANESFWKRHLDKIGVGGSIFAALCCLGFPALIAFFGVIGLRFLINDAVLIPLLLVFLAAALWGLYLGIGHHHRWSAFVLGAMGAALTLAAIPVGSGFLGGIGMAALIVASILNVVLRARQLKAR